MPVASICRNQYFCNCSLKTVDPQSLSPRSVDPQSLSQSLSIHRICFTCVGIYTFLIVLWILWIVDMLAMSCRQILWKHADTAVTCRRHVGPTCRRLGGCRGPFWRDTMPTTCPRHVEKVESISSIDGLDVRQLHRWEDRHPVLVLMHLGSNGGRRRQGFDSDIRIHRQRIWLANVGHA